MPSRLKTKPKIAIFYDWLNQWGGAERVLLDILKIFPQAPLFTLLHQPAKTPWLPAKTKVVTSFVNHLPLSQSHHRLYSPLYPLALEQFDFSQFDIVISTTTTFGHCLLTPPSTLHICYCHTPNRQIWLKPYFKFYRKIDFIYAQRPDFFIASSCQAQKRIKKFFRRLSQIIYPGIDTTLFKPASKLTSMPPYYLVVSRLVPHKKINLAIQACQQLNQKLIIVGTGRHLPHLKKISNHNTKFLDQVSEKKLISLYQHCTALICPQQEDFGLTPLEAMACGKPVIGFAKGGITETVINNKTGILFPHQTVSSLIQAINKLKNLDILPQNCRRQAQKFSQQTFMLNFKRTLLQLWHQHQITT